MLPSGATAADDSEPALRSPFDSPNEDHDKWLKDGEKVVQWAKELMTRLRVEGVDVRTNSPRRGSWSRILCPE